MEATPLAQKNGSFQADFIWVLHLAFMAFNVIAPFTESRLLLTYHAIFMPFLYMHWITNDDTCALTLLERKLRGVPSSESFFHKLVSPVYKFQSLNVNVLVWTLSYVLWVITMVRLFRE